MKVGIYRKHFLGKFGPKKQNFLFEMIIDI